MTLVGPSARCQQRQNLTFTQRTTRSLHPSRRKERNIFLQTPRLPKTETLLSCPCTPYFPPSKYFLSCTFLLVAHFTFWVRHAPHPLWPCGPSTQLKFCCEVSRSVGFVGSLQDDLRHVVQLFDDESTRVQVFKGNVNPIHAATVWNLSYRLKMVIPLVDVWIGLEHLELMSTSANHLCIPWTGPRVDQGRQ